MKMYDSKQQSAETQIQMVPTLDFQTQPEGVTPVAFNPSQITGESKSRQSSGRPDEVVQSGDDDQIDPSMITPSQRL